MPTRIAIADDKQINRTSVKEKIMSFEEIELVLEARNGHDFLEQLKQLPGEKRPQVVLMDLEMPVMDGIQTIRLASSAYPDIKFIVLTVFEDNEKIFEAIKAGAGGYLLKDDTAVNIIDAITTVVEYNGIPMSPAIARKTMELLKRSTVPVHDEAIGVVPLLTDREMEILKEMVTGKNYKAIGEKLFISPLTVRKHVAHIYEKLHVNSRAQIINLAHKNKWV
ncbi:MAG: response regulator transcription factor [Ferruginibacter sp.]|nr:response regulator transcription factor [Ferruginibacter sp.]MBU9935419.1 response regulator transcription factor [Ferruginibacter sp.]HQY11452.1 response regulator transcription factor [Ferruginibacter sp.]